MSSIISNSFYLQSIDENQHPLISGASTLGKRPFIGWQSIVTTTALSADSEDPDYPIINLWSPDTAQFWRSDTVATNGQVIISINNPGLKPIDYLGIVRHNFNTAAVTYTLQHSDDSMTWTDVVFDTPLTDKIIFRYFVAVKKLFWRLVLDIDSATPPEISHIKLGYGLILQRPIYVGHAPGILSTSTSKNTDLTDSGQYIGQVITRRWYKTDCIQQNTYPDWVRLYLVPFIQHTQYNRADDDTPQGAFFYAWRIVDYPGEVIYGWTNDDIKPVNQRPNGMMEYSFSVQGVV